MPSKSLSQKTSTVSETIEELIPGRLRIIQAQNGYRYSIDPFLLLSFLHIADASLVIDLGSGAGVLPLLLAGKKKAEKVVGLELQANLAERSRRSVALNGLQEQIDIVQGDVRALPGELAPGSFDVVVTNPPYRIPTSGRLASGDERSLARHELAGGLLDFLQAACFLLKPGGRFYVVYLAERLPELMAKMRGCRLEPKRLRMVHSREGEEARLILVEGRKNGKPGLVVEPPLVVYAGEGRDYSAEVLAMYEGEGQ